MSMGGGGGGGGGGSQTTYNTVQVPDWVQAQLSQNLGTANTLAAQPYTPYPGPTVAGFTPDQQTSFNIVQNMQGTAPSQIGAAYDIASNLPASTVSLLQPYMAKVGGDVQSGMTTGANDALSNIAKNAPATSAFGGNANQVLANTINSETNRNVGQIMNQVASTGWGTSAATAMNQAQTMGQLAGQQQAAQLQEAGALNQTGAAQQTMQQAQYANALSNWQQAQNWPYQQLSVLQSALAGSPYGSTVTSSQPYSTNQAAQAISALSSMVPILGNISNIGTSYANAFKSVFG